MKLRLCFLILILLSATGCHSALSPVSEPSMRCEVFQPESAFPFIPDTNRSVYALTGLDLENGTLPSCRFAAVLLKNLVSEAADAQLIFQLPSKAGPKYLCFWEDLSHVPELGPLAADERGYAQFASGFDAVYIYHTSLAPKLPDGDYFDAGEGPSSLFTSDSSGRLLDGNVLEAAIEQAGFRTTPEPEYQKPFTTFYPPEYSIACSDEICISASVRQLDSSYADFLYDLDTRQYYRSDRPDISFTNLFLLETDLTYSSDFQLKVDYMGGTGFYLTNGTVREIRWQTYENRIPFLALRDEYSNTLYLNAGSSYFMFYQYDEMIFRSGEEDSEP